MLNIFDSYFISLLISSVILFFIPVFLASQTIPLLSEMLKGTNTGEKMGKLLFYSTIGSFIGAVGTSTFFFQLLGVYKTGLLSSIILIFLALILLYYTTGRYKTKLISLFIFIFYIFILILPMSINTIYSTSNAYHNIDIYEINNKRIFSLNDSYSSGINIYDKTSFFQYIKEVEEKVLEIKPKNVLVIGAAGFTFPNDISGYDFIENIDVIDVDSSLKDIAEKYFLEKNLDKKIKFYSEPSRFFINKIESKKYDLILVDAYSGKNIPAQVLTYEFFKKLTNIGDNIYLNIILDTKLESTFSKNVLSTINKAFGKSYYKDVNNSGGKKTNIIVSNKYSKDYFENNINNKYFYTDDKNSIELDTFNNR